MTSLDTDFIIGLLRRKPAAESKLEELTADSDKLTTTPLNASELYKGAYNSSGRSKKLKKYGICSIPLISWNFQPLPVKLLENFR